MIPCRRLRKIDPKTGLGKATPVYVTVGIYSYELATGIVAFIEVKAAQKEYKESKIERKVILGVSTTATKYYSKNIHFESYHRFIYIGSRQVYV